MANDIIVAQPEQEKQELELIRKKFGIQEDRFDSAIMFANLIVEGHSRKKAYEQAYQATKDEATSRASSTFRAKYIQELIRYFRPDDDTLYIGEIKTIIQRGMEIVRDRRSSGREVTEAMKALQPYLKAQLQMQMTVDVEHSVKPADAVMTKLQGQIELLSSNGKMVSQNGEIIDVEEVI